MVPNIRKKKFVVFKWESKKIVYIVQRSEQLIIIPRQIVCEKLFLIQLKYYYYTCTQLSQMVQ